MISTECRRSAVRVLVAVRPSFCANSFVYINACIVQNFTFLKINNTSSYVCTFANLCSNVFSSDDVVSVIISFIVIITNVSTKKILQMGRVEDESGLKKKEYLRK